jgi:hypothetical protein
MIVFVVKTSFLQFLFENKIRFQIFMKLILN